MEPNQSAAQNDPEILQQALADPVPPPSGPQRSATGMTLQQYGFLVAVGAFVTTFAQQRVLGNLPTLFLLKNSFHLKKEDIAFFFFVATFAWNIKPIAGIFTDAFPLFGTRRRHYMLIGALVSSVCWFAMSMLKSSYAALLAISIAVNVSTVFSSTVMGGLMVEAGQAFDAPGRISALRQAVQSVAQIGGPFLGGYLAGQVFGWTTTTMLAAGSSFALFMVTTKYLKERKVDQAAARAEVLLERPNYRPAPGLLLGLGVLAVIAFLLVTNKDLQRIGISLFALHSILDLILIILALNIRNNVFIRAQNQLIQILASKTLWMAVAMLFLVYTVPGFNTALTFQQSDVLKMSTGTIGFLGSLEGLFGLAAAGLYALYCRKLNLRTMILIGISANAIFTLAYLGYNATSAYAIHSIAGFVVVLSELALMDLAVRSTPRGCEALGFALMMSVRNFGIALSDILGSNLMDKQHLSFNTLVIINALTTLAVLLFVPFLPKIVLMKRDGD